MEKRTRGDRILCGEVEDDTMVVLTEDLEIHGKDEGFEGFSLGLSLVKCEGHARNRWRSALSTEERGERVGENGRKEKKKGKKEQEMRVNGGLGGPRNGVVKSKYAHEMSDMKNKAKQFFLKDVSISQLSTKNKN
jgi:hypothetical protein